MFDHQQNIFGDPQSESESERQDITTVVTRARAQEQDGLGPTGTLRCDANFCLKPFLSEQATRPTDFSRLRVHQVEPACETWPSKQTSRSDSIGVAHLSSFMNASLYGSGLKQMHYNQIFPGRAS